MKLELKRWEETSMDAIAGIFTRANRRYLSDALPYPYTPEHARQWYQDTVQPAEGKSGLFRIIHVDGAPAGEVSIQRLPGCFSCDAEIGYLLLDEYRGLGVMTRAVEMICREAFESLGILRISASIFSPNLASQRVLEKNGFEPEGRRRCAAMKGNEIFDILLFGKLK